MSDIYFFNFQLKENTEYFLYIGELKNYGLNIFLKEALTKATGRNVEFIAIVPDILEQYNYENLIVLNPLIDTDNKTCNENLHCRVSAKEFMAGASKSPDIRALIDRILKQQTKLFLFMYESLSEMTLDEIEGVSILGPDKIIAQNLNDKSVQLSELQGIAPLVEFKICRGYGDLIKTTDALWDEWSDGIFVTKAYSAAGIHSVVARSKNDVTQKFDGTDDTYVITRFLPHEYDPTVLGVVASEDEVYIAGVADQRISGGNRFTGSTFPTVLDDEKARLLGEHTRKVGAWLAKKGYRGIFGCDYIVTDKGEIFFLEINARKQGTTLEFCCTLEQFLPDGAPNLPELEYYAVTQGKFPDNTVELPPQSNPLLHWGTYNYKIHDTVKTRSFIPQNIGERDAFQKIAAGKLKKDFLILEHVGSDFTIASGSFIARVVALGHDHQSVVQGIDQGCKTIELTFKNIT